MILPLQKKKDLAGAVTPKGKVLEGSKHDAPGDRPPKHSQQIIDERKIDAHLKGMIRKRVI